MSVIDLVCESIAMRRLGASVLDATDIGTHAMELVVNGWDVLALCEREPANTRVVRGPYGKTPHPRLMPNGVLDATNDVGMVAVWWGSGIAWNVGIRPPVSMIVLDFDDLRTLARWTAHYGVLPPTLTTISGREAGGLHMYFQHPGGKLSGKGLRGTGVDLKTHDGYLVAAPSIHPNTGRRYARVDLPVAPAPSWLVDNFLRPPTATTPRPARQSTSTMATGFWSSSSIADEFSARTSWADILEPHGWRCLDHGPDADGARWLHPAATSACSATVKNSCLFVYSTNTPFDVTETGDANGQTRFKAYAVLNHAGDMKAAARELRRR